MSMGVYIKGLHMPAEGNETIIRIQPNGVILDQYGHHLLQKAVPVPPHGRLGDLDTFESIKYELPEGQKAFNRGFHSGVQYVQRLIMDAPTIIPAEEGE